MSIQTSNEASSSTSKLSPSTRLYAPYLTPSSLTILSDRQREKAPGRQALTETKVEQRRAKACGLIEAVASRMGFPRRTIATAQLLFHRFHLSNPPADYAYHVNLRVEWDKDTRLLFEEVALSALLLSSKMNDTPKRTRDILLSSYALRFPELIKLPDFKAIIPTNKASLEESDGNPIASTSSNSTESVGKEGNGTITNSGLMSGYIQNANTLASVPEDAVNQKAFDTERKRLLSLERLHLECSCFNFQLRAQQVLGLVVKISRKWNISRDLSQSAWRIAADSHRTLTPLQYPPSVLALASIYLAALLRSPRSSAGRSPVREFTANESGETFSKQKSSSDFVISVFSGEAEAQKGTENREATLGWEEEMKAHIEDVEEVVHTLLDLLVSSCQTLPSTIPGSISLTTSPSSPAEPSSDPAGLDQIGTQIPNKKLPPHAFSPPPLSLLNWINEKWSNSSKSSNSTLRDFGQELAHLLTESKIWLRGVEDLRVKKDLEILNDEAQSNGAGPQSGLKRSADLETDEEREKERGRRNAARRRDINFVRTSWTDIGDVNLFGGNEQDDLAARQNRHQPKQARFLF